MEPKFIYFDMGNVLLNFSHEREAEQVAHVAGLEPRRVWNLLFEEGLHWVAERGEVTRKQYYARFCEATGSRPDSQEFEQAGNDIFWLNASIAPLVGHLRSAGYRLGVLSNTSEAHWEHCTSRFRLMNGIFGQRALSFQIGAMKPHPNIFAEATRIAGVAPEEILFIDDRPDNVAAARAAGWDAVQFESTSKLHRALLDRGVTTNY